MKTTCEACGHVEEDRNALKVSLNAWRFWEHRPLAYRRFCLEPAFDARLEASMLRSSVNIFASSVGSELWGRSCGAGVGRHLRTDQSLKCTVETIVKVLRSCFCRSHTL
jgi:hypothetical protein